MGQWQVIEDDDATWYIIHDGRMKGAGFLDLEEAHNFFRSKAQRDTEADVERLDGTHERIRA